jgi:vacuolar-type H+-ATPase subunit H
MRQLDYLVVMCLGIGSMKRIIEAVLQAEEKANTTLRQAQTEASEMKRAAEKEISDKTHAAQEKAQEIIQATVAEARAEAQRIRAEKLEQADQEKDALRLANAEMTGDLVDRICQTILSTEYQREIP